MAFHPAASVLVKDVLIYNGLGQPESELQDILVLDGLISAIGTGLTVPEGITVIEGKGAAAIPGLFDMLASCGEPGHEHLDTFSSLTNAALAGGFTGIAISPNAGAAADTQDYVHFVRHKGSQYGCDLFPYAAISQQQKGQKLADLIDLQQAGAIGYYDGSAPIHNTDLMVKALQYAQHTGLMVINRPEDHWLAQFGQMHEGFTSTLLGLKAIPSLAEVMMVKRDLDLLRHVGGRLHLSCLSTAEAVNLVRAGKAEGLAVSASVSVAQLLFTDQDLGDLNSNLKAEPPFRSEADKTALLAGLKDGTIDVVVTNHTPLDIESKRLEFDMASPGMIMLQTALPALLTAYPDLNLEFWIPKLGHNARALLLLAQPNISVGEVAQFIVIDPDQTFEFSAKVNKSKSANTPLFNKKLKGRILASAYHKISIY
jgi:dihydroorotase